MGPAFGWAGSDTNPMQSFSLHVEHVRSQGVRAQGKHHRVVAQFRVVGAIKYLMGAAVGRGRRAFNGH